MNPVLLIILDGFGEGKAYPGNAITLAKTPTLESLRKNNLVAFLKASGKAVGIPEGTQGGSEVGHFTIGAGRTVLQPLEEINEAIAAGSFFEKPALLEACQRAKKHGAKLHLLGMISDQGVHADIRHLFALLELAKREKVPQIKIHAITDGRDVPEKSAEKFVAQIEAKIHELKLEDSAKIATMCGRYFAMDRDENWERIELAYDLYALGQGIREKDPSEAIRHAYENSIETDYYIEPTILDPDAVVKDPDSVIFWNFRSDRAREITWCFTGEKNSKTGKPAGFLPKKTVRPYFVCMGPYSEKAPVLFPTHHVENNLSQVISQAGLKQLRIAETQKYAHVTYFFNSQMETAFPGEDRVMLESKKCHSYEEIPEMSAREITSTLIEKLETREYPFIAVNFANCDLVGHSGNLKATIQAVEVIDECLGKILPKVGAAGYTILITGDHGNAEYMIYEENGEECPSHTTNPVPLFAVKPETGAKIKIQNSKSELQDIAPTILKIMGIPQPREMTGKSLL